MTEFLDANGLNTYHQGVKTLINGAIPVKLTQAEYDALPNSKYTDGKVYFITDRNDELVDEFLTQAEYDALPNSKYTDGKVYFITDRGIGNETASHIIYDNSTSGLDATNVQEAIDEKQDILISGTNIKTINNNSLVGSGNITLTASEIPYGHTASGLTATNVQDAIDEVVDESVPETRKINNSTLDTDLEIDFDSVLKFTSWVNTAGFHNSIFRGKYLGSSVTSDQYAAVAEGTFDGLYLGDYWTINGINWRIWGFDYYYDKYYSPSSGSFVVDGTTHHVVIMPDELLFNPDGATKYMKDTDTLDGGFCDTYLKQTYLDQIYTTLCETFGEEHIIQFCERLSNNSDGSGGTYVGLYSCIPSTMQLLGMNCSHMNVDEAYGSTVFPLSILAPKYIIGKNNSTGDRAAYWLRSIVPNQTQYFAIHSNGCIVTRAPSATNAGIRPYFILGVEESSNALQLTKTTLENTSNNFVSNIDASESIEL